jgi:hypothetical protein
MLSKKSNIERSEKSHKKSDFSLPRFCKPRQDMYEALQPLSCESMWSLSSPRVGRAGGPEKFGLPAEKYFFDNIGPSATSEA